MKTNVIQGLELLGGGLLSIVIGRAWLKVADRRERKLIELISQSHARTNEFWNKLGVAIDELRIKHARVTGNMWLIGGCVCIVMSIIVFIGYINFAV